MTSFNTLFNRMFQEKSRTVYLIYLIQAFASLCFSVWMIISMKGDTNVMVINGHHKVTNHLISYLLIFGVMMFITSFLLILSTGSFHPSKMKRLTVVKLGD